MSAPSDRTFLALDNALRQAVLAEIDASMSHARRDAEDQRRDAELRANAFVEHARRDAEAAADAALAREYADVRRHATERVLAAKQAALAELRTRSRDAVICLRDDTRYSEMLDRLMARAQARLGSGTLIIRDPPPVGGIIATNGVQRLDYTLPALAERALEARAETIEEL